MPMWSLSKSGGTVGDPKTLLHRRLMRELAYEEGAGSCVCGADVHPEPHALGEQKSKAAQLGIKQLMQMGIQPTLSPAVRKIRSRFRPARR
jgi:CTP synthase